MSRGGKRNGAGRPPGAFNKGTAEIKVFAQQYGQAAIARLAELSGLVAGTIAAESQVAQIAAIKELLDRGYGKASQPISGDSDGPPLRVDFRWADATGVIAKTVELIEDDDDNSVVVAFSSTPLING